MKNVILVVLIFISVISISQCHNATKQASEVIAHSTAFNDEIVTIATWEGNNSHCYFFYGLLWKNIAMLEARFLTFNVQDFNPDDVARLKRSMVSSVDSMKFYYRNLQAMDTNSALAKKYNWGARQQSLSKTIETADSLSQIVIARF